MAQPLIEIKNLQFTYSDEQDREGPPVLKGIDLTIERGEYVAILGHNGSGKSTLAKLLNLILEPTAGTILFDGSNITAPDMTEEELYALRRRVGMVFQNPDNQLVATLVEEDVAFGPENLGLEPSVIRQRVDEALDMVGMREYARHEPHRLSGGQKQRVAIAGVIAMMPECMILDEATAMLDPVGRREVIDTVEMLHKEKGLTLLTITHHMDEAARADRIVVLDDGQLLLDGTPEQVFSRYDVLKAAGLDVPQSAAVIHGLRRAGVTLEGNLGSMSDCVETICRAWQARAKNLQ